MSSDEFASLHDIYAHLSTDDDKSNKTTYILQFLWRDLTSKFDVVGPYFTCAGTLETKFLHSVVTKTMLSFTQFGFHVRVLLCDGASTNLSLLKLLCGQQDDSIQPWFTSPFDGKTVYAMICPSHQVRKHVSSQCNCMPNTLL